MPHPYIICINCSFLNNQIRKQQKNCIFANMENDSYKFGCFFQIVLISVGMAFTIADDIYGIIFGSLLGIAICCIVGKVLIKWELEGESGYLKKINNKVLDSITRLSYLVMKADEGITNSELYAFRDYMLHNFGSDTAAKAIELMKYLKHVKISSQKATDVLNAKLNYSEKMQIMQYLFQLATSDGRIQATELEVLGQIANEMQILQNDFTYMKNAYQNMYNRRYSSGQNQHSSSVIRSNSLENAYAVLGIKSTDSDADIKTAYRRLAIANHPDKVQHLGETAHDEAEKRFSQINEAYNKIKKERKL